MAKFISDEDMAKLEASSSSQSKPKKIISDDEMAELENQGKTSQAESALGGFVEGSTFGFSDEIAGGVGGLMDYISQGGKLDLEDYYKIRRDLVRENQKKAKADNPGTFMTGELAGGLVSPVGNIGKGASVGKMALAGAGVGALGGAGYSEGEDLADVAMDAAKGGAIGGVMSGGLGLAGKGVNKLLSKTANKSSDVADDLAARAIGAERGTIKKLGSEKVKEAGRRALDEGIVTPFASTDDMILRNKASQRNAGKAMSEVYDVIDNANASTFNPLDAAIKVDDEIGGFWRSPLNKTETKQLDNTLESILMRADETGSKNISVKEAQKLKEELGKVANWKSNVSITDKERMARDAYKVISDEIDNAVEMGAEKVGIAGLPEKLKLAKKQFGDSKTAEELLKNKLARESGNKMFGLTDTIAGSGGAVAGGPVGLLATILGKKATERFGYQTGAVAADKLSKVLAEAPEMFGKYAGILKNASVKGNLPLVHELLMRNDPEYKAMMGD